MRFFETGKEVIKTIKSHGKEAYFVGGFVRDLYLKRESLDIDITTSATPEEVMTYFNIVKNTGRKYGTVTVIVDDFKFEVTTFRQDGEYVNNRKPEDVTYTLSLEEDLKRRDFTMNAIVIDENEEVTDYFGGIQDIENKVIKSIGNPHKRFIEDALRMLRAFRFVSQIGFDIEQQTLEALKEQKHLIRNISIERVMVELNKLFLGPYKQKAIQYLVETTFHEELYGMKDGLEQLQTVTIEYVPLEAFMVCFALNDIDDIWKFSNREMKVMVRVINLHEVTKEGKWNKYILFSNGLDLCLLTNKVSVLLGYEDQSIDINAIWNSLLVKDVCDLKFKGQDILELTNLRKRSVIALVIDDLLYNVINEIMPNDYHVLKEFALQRVEELQKEMEDKNE
jgi:tRNA nucleotidyltransferase (CCA-adding enzyme)